ncbi:hypothetical protein [Qipengyuania sp. SM2507]
MTDAHAPTAIRSYPGASVRWSPQQPRSLAGEPTASLPSLLMAPMRYSQYYLWGTFGIFLMSNLVWDVENFPVLIAFLFFAFGGFYGGYRLAIGNPKTYRCPPSLPDFGDTPNQKKLIFIGATYFLIWGLNQFVEFGASGLGSIVQAILSPGEAYGAKFDVYEAQIDDAYVSPLVQVLILASLVYALFLPLAVASWANISRATRWFVGIATAIYIMSYLFIGTMKGIGDVMLFIICGGAVYVGKRSLMGQGFNVRRRVRGVLLGLGVVLFAYMTFNQLQRAEEFGITESAIVGDVSDTFIAQTFGDRAAYGIYQVLAYPSHGYLGLSYSMSVPFEFSRGAGISQAFESYRFQYLGGIDNTLTTYPFRSERVTGWPAGMFWSTIFPWLASDMTFFLIPFFMAAMGAIFARLWVNCLYGVDVLALTALGQFFVFIAFIPANNQVMLTRQGFWVVLTLIAFAIARMVTKPRQR